MAKKTAAVIVRFTLNSADPSPYFIKKCEGEIDYSDGTRKPFSGFDPLDVGTPKTGGADFFVLVHDDNYDNSPTTIDKWALTFLPRSPTSDPSPISPQNTITGDDWFFTDGDFVLELPANAKIKPRTQPGSWDWSLMVQIVLDSGDTHCFVSDPEMDVDPLVLSNTERDALFRFAENRQRAAVSGGKRTGRGKPARATKSAKKRGGKRR